MSKYRAHLSGREGRRRAKEAAETRRGAGWTRSFRKGRVQRHPRQGEEDKE